MVNLYSHLYDNHDEAAMYALDAAYEGTLNPNVTPLGWLAMRPNRPPREACCTSLRAVVLRTAI
jgi:hypothetical protein